MADPKKETFDLGADQDFDFNKIAEFETDAGAIGTDGPEEADYASFGSSGDSAGYAFDDDKTVFPSSGAEPDFATDFEPGNDFSAQAIDPFDFAEPPSPESVELASMNGNPDEEFGDFGGPSAGNDDFYAGNTATPDPFADDDANDAYQANGTVDPFADDGDQAQEDEQPAAAPAKEASKLGVKQLGGLAVAVALVGYVGFTQVLPMFIPQDGGQVVAENQPAIDQGQLPSTLPATSTNVTPTLEPTPGVKDIAAVPAPVDGTPQLALPGINLDPVATAPVTQTAQADQPVAVAPDAKPTDKVPDIALPGTVKTANTPVAADPIEDFVGGNDRGGIGSMKDAEPVVEVAAPAVAPAALESITKRLDDVIKRIETIERRVADIASAAPVETTVASLPVPATDTAVVVPANPGLSAPLKPPIIETAVLRGVSRDVAWIATGKDVVEVKVGDTIPNAGVVESFQNYRGRWIAVTDKGIILPR
jgi:hypothetical protein|nr:hypothetical protein [Neorhizobium tomejilense]